MTPRSRLTAVSSCSNSSFGIYRDTSGTFDLQVGATLVTMTPLVPGDSLSITIDVGAGPFLFSYVVFADRIKGLGGPTGAGIFLEEARLLNETLVRDPRVCCWEICEINPLLDVVNTTVENSLAVFQAVVDTVVRRLGTR